MATNAIATLTEPQELERQARDLTTQATTFRVIDLDTFQAAGQMRVTIKTYTKQVHEVFDPIVDAAHKAHKVAVEQRKKLLEPAEGADRVLAARMDAFDRAQEVIRQEAERLAREEQARLEAEALAAAEEETKRRQAEAEEATLAVAIQAEEQGDAEAAEQILAQPVFVPPVLPQPVFAPPVQVQRPVASGISFRDNWSATVTDFKALVQAVATGKAPLTYLEANLTALNGVARALKDHMAVPGVKAENKRSSPVRS